MTIIILIIIILLLLAFTVYLLCASKSKFHQLAIIKVPIPPISSDKRVYMSAFIKSLTK